MDLQTAYLDKSLPTEIRYLAIIQIKNGIDKYWRKHAPNALKPEEKSSLRAQLLQGGVDEADTHLALQNALAISKVVRIDYPLEWPEVLPELIIILRTASESNQLHLRRGLLILLQIVKELASARLRKSQTSLQSITPEIVFLLSNIYTQKVNAWYGFLTSGGDDEGGAMDAMENSLLAMKILRRLLIFGYQYPNHEKEVQELWGHSQQQFGQFLDLVTRDPPFIISPAKDFVEKHLLQLSKLHVEMSKTHPASFALLPHSLDLARAYWGLISKFGDSYGSSSTDFASRDVSADHNPRNEREMSERLSLKGLSLLRACMKMVFSPARSFRYESPKAKQEQRDAVDLIKTQLLTEDLVSQMASVIVTKFFVFRQKDLEAWEDVRI
jgi:hypothetical protein